MFNKLKRPSTYSRKEKARPNLAFQNYHACEEAFDHLKKNIQQRNKNQLDESRKPKFFYKNWRAHNDTSDFNSINKSEDSNPMFKDLDDVSSIKYQMSFISSKELKKTVKNKKRDVNVKIKKKRKNKVINLVERFNKRTPSTENQKLYFSTPVREEKATFPKLNFSPISDSINTNQSIQPPRLSDVLLQFDNLKLETPLKDSTVSVDTGNIVLEPGKKWRRSFLKLKHAETCENRGLRQGRKSCTNALIENDLHSQLKRDAKFCFSNPFMKLNFVWQKPSQLFGIKEILTPHKNQSSNDHKRDEVHQKSTSSIVNLVDIENKLNINEKKEIIDADLRRKTHYNKSILSKERIVHFSPPNELLSHSVYSNRPKLSLKNQITMKRKTYYKPDTSKDQSIHFPYRNTLISNNDGSKLKLSNRITTKRKTYGKPDTVKDQISYFSTPNELISDGDDSDRSIFRSSSQIKDIKKISYDKPDTSKDQSVDFPSRNSLISYNDRSKVRLNNQITSRRKTYDKPDISKDQSVNFPPPNELISDSEDCDRSIFRSSSQITDIKKISYDKPDTSKDQNVDFPSRNSLISYNDRSKVRLNNQITSRRKTYDKPDISKDQSVNFPPPNELISDSEDCDRSIFRSSSQITDIKKISYDKPDTSKDQSVDFPSRNSLISYNDRSKVRLTNRITTKRKIYDKPDALKNRSLQFSHPNELISSGDDSDRSTLRLNNGITSRRNTYYKPNISKDQSVHFPSSNELISDSDGSDRYIFSGSSRITAIKKISNDNLDTSKDQSVNFPPPSELISDSDDCDSYIFSSSNRITAIKKIAYDKPDTPQDQSVHFPPLNELMFGSEDNDRSKLRLSDQIAARRKTFGTPDTSKDQSVYFPSSNELISDSGDSVRSKLNLCNGITARRKTFYNNSDLSKEQSDYNSSPSSDELFYDDASNRSELSIRKRIPIETSPLHFSYTYYPELQTKSKENITLSSSATDSCNNSSDNSELIKKNLEDVTNKSLTKSIRRSKLSDQFKGFDEANNSHTLKNSHMKRSLSLFSEYCFYDDYGDNNIRINSEEYVTRVQKDISIKYTSPSLEGASVIPTVMTSENTKAQDNGNSFASELKNTNLTLTMQNALASRNITDRKTRSERGQEFRQNQKSPTEFEADGSGSFVQELQERLHFSDPILFDSEEEFIEDEQIETRFSNQIGGPFKNCSSTSSSDLQNLECKNVFNHLSLNKDSFQSLQARESNLNSPNFENPECKYELHHSSPTADSFQDLQGRKSMLDSHSFKGCVVCEPDINKVTLKEDTSFSSEICESEYYSCDNDEVAFRCILHRCCQNTIINFIDAFSVAELKNSKKIGEGVYGEVFLVKRFSDPEDSVIKIIPVQGDYVVNGEVQKTYSEILSELIISQELDSLRDSDDFFTDNFCKVKKLWCLQGKYPDRLQELWNKYNKLVGSENDSPTMFSSNQQYIVLELGHGGQALADYKFSSARQAFSIFLQTSFALAVGEQCFEFEHRDLHWGNVLVMKTTDKYAMFIMESETYRVPTFGVKATIIDYTLSRMIYAGTVNFNDLSIDPDMFKGTGDYQFDIYRIMQQLLCNDWSRYVPKTNIKWLDYIVDKLLNKALYTNPKSKIHLKFIKILENLRTIMTDFDSVYDYVVYLGTVYYETSGPFVIHNLG